MMANRRRKSYNNRFSLVCHFCEIRQEKKEDLRLIYLTQNTVVKVCLDVIDHAHNFRTEELK